MRIFYPTLNSLVTPSCLFETNCWLVAMPKRKKSTLVRFLAGLWMVVACGVLGLSQATAETVSMSETAVASSGDQEMEKGRSAFHRGAFAQAAVHWTEAAHLYEQDGGVKKQCQALINLAHALQQEGQVRKAMVTLQAALKLSHLIGTQLQTAMILGRLGNVSFALGQGDLAVDHLTKALVIAREEKKTALVAILLNDLGNVLASLNQRTEAIDVYAEAHTLANETGQPALAVTAMINMAMAFLEDQQFAESGKRLDLAYRDIQTLEDSHSKAYGFLNIGLGYDDLRVRVTSPRMLAQVERQMTASSRGLATVPGQSPQALPLTPSGKPGKPSTRLPKEPGSESLSAGSPASSSHDNSLFRQASESFQAAAQIAVRLRDSRTESYAWGYLGQLLEEERRYSDALDFTRKAVFAAQKANAPESLYQWHWQTARLLKVTGKEDDALSAYKRAVSILRPIRYEYSVGYQGRHNSFRESVTPLFTELEDMLLTRAALAQNPEQTQHFLVQVRDTVETSRAAELQDYFRDDCVANARAKRSGGDAIPQHTAVVYPIILPDRLELLVQMGGDLKRFRVSISAEKLTQEVRAFRRTLQDRLSTNYLQYAQTLYSWLMAPLQPDFTAVGIDTLVFVPDGPLRTIPMAALHDGKHFVVDRYAVAVSPSMDLTDPRPIDRGKINLLSMGLTESVQGFPALPHVATEVDAIKNLYGGRLLMDSQFLVPSMEHEMKEQEVAIVHIASHGVVENDVNKSFLLAYDEKITMDRLSQLVGLLRYRQTPIELLTLSACETAVGDDRAALGLAGMAVKAGARSALASLWFIDDKATADLVTEFYRQLRDPSVTKAVALQRAQLKILSEPGHEHPSFWAAFLLINNWL